MGVPSSGDAEKNMQKGSYLILPVSFGVLYDDKFRKDSRFNLVVYSSHKLNIASETFLANLF
jgi:hypothetical protein